MRLLLIILTFFSLLVGCIEGEEVELWGECYNIETTTSLELWGNQLTGEIPPEIGNLINLEILFLHGNHLTGEIPSEIGNLINLEFLFLNNNQLSGEIPSELGNLTNLEYFYLFYNQLTGEIPRELGNLINLKWLFLDNNQLTGEIPLEIASLTNLERLYLQYNQLTGEIPSEVCLYNIWDMSFRNNKLCPPYPDCVFEEDLYYQDISECGEDEYINLTPDGPLIEYNAPLWGNKGYQFTVQQTFTMYAGEWWIYLPDNAYIRASIYDFDGNLLEMGAIATSDSNQEKWYRSELEFTFEEGETYTLSFYCNQSYDAIFDFIDFDIDLQPFNVGDVLTDVWSRSSSSDTEEQFPDYLGNSWAPFQRMVTVIAESGDMNSDGIVNILDVIIITNLILNNQYENNADLNDDNTINVQDIIILINWILE